MKLTETNAFVGYNDIPQLDAGESVFSAFRQMSERQTGAVIVSSSRRPHWLLAGDWLKPAYDKMSLSGGSITGPDAGSAAANVAEMPIATFLGRAANVPPVTVGPAISVTSTVDSVRQYGGNPVFPVMDPSDRWIGWYFYQEEFLNAFLGKAPVFMCERGHANPDPDHGYCYQCPAPIRQ